GVFAVLVDAEQKFFDAAGNDKASFLGFLIGKNGLEKTAARHVVENPVGNHVCGIDCPAGIIKGVYFVIVVAEDHSCGIVCGGNGKTVEFDRYPKFDRLIPGRCRVIQNISFDIIRWFPTCETSGEEQRNHHDSE